VAQPEGYATKTDYGGAFDLALRAFLRRAGSDDELRCKDNGNCARPAKWDGEYNVNTLGGTHFSVNCERVR
jgi:hypothetical protein